MKVIMQIKFKKKKVKNTGEIPAKLCLKWNEKSFFQKLIE